MIQSASNPSIAVSFLNTITSQDLRRILAFSVLSIFAILLILVMNYSDQNIADDMGRHKNNRYYSFSDPSSASSFRMWDAWTSHVRFCLLERIKNSKLSIWRTLHQHVTICVGEGGWRMLDAKALRNLDDIKFAILPRSLNLPHVFNMDSKVNDTVDAVKYRANFKTFPPSDKFQNCIVVTLGIGNDILAELKLQKLLPNCNFFGADPSLEQGLMYETVLHGRFFQTAIAHRGGFSNASIRGRDGYYRTQNKIQTTSFVDFVAENVESKHIDFLFMDNEGAEYGILQQFSSEIINENIVVCQMSVELHGPLGEYAMNETMFGQLIIDLLGRSPMLPVWSSEPINHMRSFYINANDPYCKAKYFSIHD